MTTKPTSTRLEHLIEEQARKWQLAMSMRRKRSEPHPPVITISRQPGSGDHIFAHRIAEELNLDIFDDKIIHEIAESAKMSEKVVSSLDEKMRSTLDNWIQFLRTTRFFFSDKYFLHLTKVIGATGRHGGALIIGRGANLILPAEETLRIRLIAPMAVKIKNLSEGLNISPEVAEERIIRIEAERKAFIKKHFKVDIDDPINYDIVINTQFMDVDKIIKLVKSSLKFKKPKERRSTDKKAASKK
ncbi:MAG: cytidylate kinase-like family protein [Deltaproteobacteria bacterium]|nr:cytidylate kinase-like family protein [Deltaproteobacteria bacterium]MBN2845508.1 cytidylate kinase-like family protein [Deltaproteobacteria bacterium]